jgi:hypothetical protein
LRMECGKEPQFQCPYCPQKSKLKGNLKQHIMCKHVDLVADCNKCLPLWDYLYFYFFKSRLSVSYSHHNCNTTFMPSVAYFQWSTRAPKWKSCHHLNSTGGFKVLYLWTIKIKLGFTQNIFGLIYFKCDGKRMTKRTEN